LGRNGKYYDRRTGGRNGASTFAPDPHTLDSHSNVTVTSNTAGEILKWSGTAWINNTLVEAGIAAASHTHSYSEISDFDEGLLDRINALFVEGTNVTFNYDDGANTFTISASVAGGAGDANLADDETVTGAWSFNGSGIRLQRESADPAGDVGYVTVWGRDDGSLRFRDETGTVRTVAHDATVWAASAITSGEFADARISQSSVTQYQGALALGAGQVTTGTFADARISASSVTQHEAALTITNAQVSDFGAGVDSRITSTWRGQVDGLASLDGSGKIPTSQLPALAITNTYVVANEAGQLAAGAEEGDVVVRTDQNKSYVHNGGSAGTMSDFQELLTPTDTVLSVNGQTGAVTLTKSDVGLGNVEDTALSTWAGSTALTTTGTVVTGTWNSAFGAAAIETIEDLVGGFATGGTQTLITVTYDDPNSRFDFVVDNDLSNYDNGASGFLSSVDLTSDVTGRLPAANFLSAGAYSLLLRNAGTSGDAAFVKISGLTAEESPAAGGLLLYETSGGELRKVDWGDLPSGGGSGDVTKVGTPVNNELAVWTGDGTLEGEANVTYSAGVLNVNGTVNASAFVGGNYTGEWQGNAIIPAHGGLGSALTPSANQIPRFTGAASSDLIDYSTDGTLSGNSATTLVSESAIVTYVSSKLVGLLDYNGAYDAAANSPNLDSTPTGVKKGDTYTVTTSGTFFTATVEPGDFLIAEIDDPTTLANWTVVNTNIGAATTTAAGIVELATAAETQTGTDPNRALTPAGLAGVTDLSGYSWFENDSDFSGDSGLIVKSEAAIKAFVEEKAIVERAYALSGQDEDASTGTKLTFHLMDGFELEAGGVMIGCNGDNTGAAIIVDVQDDGVSILTTKPEIAAGDETSNDGGSSVSAVLSSTTLAAGSKISVVVDQVGSTVAGTGLKLYLKGRRI